MSIQEITPRLWWDGQHGLARADGVEVELTAPPPIASNVIGVDFAPTLRTFGLRESACAWRDMTRDEIERCRELLDRIARAAHAALEAR
jgi:hypothetical protein